MANNEFDEILASLKEQRDKLDKLGVDDFDLKSVSKDDNDEFEMDIQEPVVNYNAKQEKAPKEEKTPKVKIKQKAKKEKPKKTKGDKKPKQKKQINNKKIIIISMILALVVAVLVLVGVYYGNNAYLRPYKQKYGISYPKGIVSEMCDAYGQNQNVVAKIELDGEEALVSSKVEQGMAFKSKGTNVKPNQQFRSFDVSGVIDLEKNYSNSNAFLKSSQCLNLTTLYEKNQYKAVAAFYTNEKPEQDKGYVFPYNCYGNMTIDSASQYRQAINSRQLYFTSYVLSADDEVVTLSADTDFMPNFKFVVVFAKINGEFKKETKATANNNVRYPQAYYDENGIKNTYLFSNKWYPEIYVQGNKNETKKLTIDDFKFR